MIKISNLSCSYGKEKVVNNIDLTFAKGENYCILGPNGCGKTTLLKAISNAIPFQGEINVNSQSIQNLKREEIAKKIAVLSQINDVFFPYSVYDTVMMGRYIHFKNSLFPTLSNNDKKIVDECLKELNLYNLRDKNIQELSGGQRQMVFLAKALVQQPDIILLDEPTNHLDIQHQLTLINYLKKWSKGSSKTVIGVFHDINLALNFSDNIIFMQDGNIVAKGKFDNIATPTLLNEIYKADIASFMINSLEKWRNI